MNFQNEIVFPGDQCFIASKASSATGTAEIYVREMIRQTDRQIDSFHLYNIAAYVYTYVYVTESAKSSLIYK